MKHVCWACLMTLLIPSGSPAAACEQLQALRAGATSNFKAIRGQVTPYEGLYATSHMLPGANKCEILMDDAKTAEYRCTWFFVRDIADPAMAKEAFISMGTSLAACLPSQDQVLKKNTRLGEDVSFNDPVEGEPLTVYRTVFASYEKSGYWWQLNFSYSIARD